MKLFQRLFVDHRFDEWASDQMLISARVLNQAAADLILMAEQDLAEAGWKDGLFDANAFIMQRIAPRVREVAEPLARAIIEEANGSLQSLIDMRAIWSRSIETAPLASNTLEGLGDIAVAVLPFGTGAATAAALPFAAVTTTTAMFGLVSTTAISWPVVVGGGALAGLGIVTGVVEGARLWSKIEARLRRRTRQFVVAALLKGDADHPAILEQLNAEFERVAREAKAAA